VPAANGRALLPPRQHLLHRFFDAQVRVVQQQRVFGGLQGRTLRDLSRSSRAFKSAEGLSILAGKFL
jgi:hypothetical protein